MTSRLDPDKRMEYAARINRVIDYIQGHMADHLSLPKLAAVAHFSPFHFHRIFHAFVGETLNQFIQRIRLEKAACLLVIDQKKPVTDIALDCGFSGSPVFARAFKEAFGMTASRWRAGGCQIHRNIRKTESNADQKPGNIRTTISKNSKDFQISSMYLDPETNHLKWRIDMNEKKEAKVTVKDLPEMTVAYIRHIGPYKADTELFGRLFNALFTWAGPRGLLRFPETKVMSVYYDDPEITDAEKLRVDVCITVPEDTEISGEVGKMTIPAGKYAMARFELNADEYQDAWDAVYGGWLPRSGFQPDDRPSFELCLNDPKEHPEGKHIVDICIPVKPA